jgi:hypothetical protein
LFQALFGFKLQQEYTERIFLEIPEIPEIPEILKIQQKFDCQNVLSYDTITIKVLQI